MRLSLPGTQARLAGESSAQEEHVEEVDQGETVRVESEDPDNDEATRRLANVGVVGRVMAYQADHLTRPIHDDEGVVEAWVDNACFIHPLHVEHESTA